MDDYTTDQRNADALERHDLAGEQGPPDWNDGYGTVHPEPCQRCKANGKGEPPATFEGYYTTPEGRRGHVRYCDRCQAEMVQFSRDYWGWEWDEADA